MNAIYIVDSKVELNYTRPYEISELRQYQFQFLPVSLNRFIRVILDLPSLNFEQTVEIEQGQGSQTCRDFRASKSRIV